VDEASLIKALSSTPGGVGLAVVFALILYKVASRIAERMIAALDRVAAKVEEHTTKDLEHHAEVREAVVRLEAKLDERLAMWDRSDSFERPEREHTPPSIPRHTTASEASERRRRRVRTPPRGSGTD
jgi:hypothetical protein